MQTQSAMPAQVAIAAAQVAVAAPWVRHAGDPFFIQAASLPQYVRSTAQLRRRSAGDREWRTFNARVRGPRHLRRSVFKALVDRFGREDLRRQFASKAR